MEKVRMGIIGLGRIADLNVLGYLDHPKCELIAVCDLDEDLAKKRMAEWCAKKYYTDYHKLLADDEIDAVEILSPHKLHRPMVVDAAEAGKHVSVQKPMCVSLQEADQMIRACREASVKFKVFENFVFYPPYRKAKELIQEGAIGEPLSINVKLGISPGGWWVPFKTWLWHIDPDECGGLPATYDDGFHKMSIARYFFGEVDTVKAWIDLSCGVVDTPAVITWNYKEANRSGIWEENFSPGIIMNCEYYGADERVEICGSEGVIYVTRCAARLMEIPALVLYRRGESRGFDDMRDDWGDSFHDCGWDFIDSIVEDRDPCLTGHDGKAIMQFWKAVYHSSVEGKEFRPDEMKDSDK